ncbi:hypothetical protein ACWCQK_36285 [Streptomyces sp. NPDC002306]
MTKNLGVAVKSVSLTLVSAAAILSVVVPATAQASSHSVTAADGVVVVTPDDRGGW